MRRNLLLAALCVVVSVGAANPGRMPVLVELFTSEGCSSCPPADRLLQRLDRQTIVLSEHVDYWDQQGWKDRFSSHVFTERQEAYARQFTLDAPYTPQMVVDGAAQFVGSDVRRASAEIDQAAGRPKVGLRITRAATGVWVESDPVPSAADVMLAVADDGDASQVAAGENKGLDLRYVAVVRSLRKIGSVKRGASFGGQVALPAATASQRIVVFLQEPGQARISGAAMLAAGGV